MAWRKSAPLLAGHGGVYIQVCQVADVQLESVQLAWKASGHDTIQHLILP